MGSGGVHGLHHLPTGLESGGRTKPMAPIHPRFHLLSGLLREVLFERHSRGTTWRRGPASCVLQINCSHCCLTQTRPIQLLHVSLGYRHEFKWFCHTYSHKQAHLMSTVEMDEELRLNKAFAVVSGKGLLSHDRT